MSSLNHLEVNLRPESNSQERKALLAEYEHLQSQLVNVARRLNALTQPSRLPSELLADVFAHLNPYPLHHVSAGGGPSAANPYHPTDAAEGGGLDLVRASHVCFTWREVALSFPQPWSSVMLNGPTYIDMFLHRAKSCPLDVWFGKYHETGSLARTRLRENLHRIRTIYLPYEVWRTFKPLDPSENATYDAIRLFTYVEGIENGSQPWSIPYNSESLLSTLRTPNLRHAILALDNQLWKGLSSYSSLRSLTIQSWMGISPKPTIIDVVTLLRELPALDRLTWYDFRDVEGVIAQHGCTVSLPGLQHIELHGDILPCGSLLQHLNLSPGTNISVNTNISMPWDESVYPEWRLPALDIATVIASMNPYRPGSLDCLHLTFLDSDGWGTPTGELRAWTLTPAPGSIHKNEHSPLRHTAEFSIPHDPRPGETFPWTHPAFAARCVSIDHHRGRTDARVLHEHRLLSVLPPVEELCFKHGRAPHLLALLDADPPPFPRLRELRFQGCFSTVPVACHGRWPAKARMAQVDDSCDFCAFLPQLMTLLRARRDAGLPAIHLYMPHFPTIMSPEDEQELCELAASVSSTEDTLKFGLTPWASGGGEEVEVPDSPDMNYICTAWS